MGQLNVIRQEAFAWLESVAAYAGTLPVAVLVALAIPSLAALIARSAGAFMITVLLTVIALSIPNAGPSERYQYSTLILIVVSGLVASLLGAARRPRKVAPGPMVSADLEEARRQIDDLEVRLQRERVWRTGSRQ